MADNKLSGAELKNLLKYDQLRIIKFGANLIKDFADLESLVNIEISTHKFIEISS